MKTSCVVNTLANGFNTFPLTINLICSLFLEGYISQSPSPDEKTEKISWETMLEAEIPMGGISSAFGSFYTVFQLAMEVKNYHESAPKGKILEKEWK